MPQAIPGYHLEFHVLTASPYDVRIRLVNDDGAFDWQCHVTAAHWVSLIAAITGAVGTAGATSKLSEEIDYAGSLAANDYMP
jgi:hypothetical protein